MEEALGVNVALVSEIVEAEQGVVLAQSLDDDGSVACVDLVMRQVQMQQALCSKGIRNSQRTGCAMRGADRVLSEVDHPQRFVLFESGG